MTIELKLTALPDSITEASLISWYKKPGESVTIDEKLADIETDKVILDFPSPVAGVLTKIIAEEGSVINTESVLAIMEEGDIATMDSPETDYNPVSIPDKQKDIMLSPAVKNLVNQYNLEVGLIPATGKKGQILKGDVLDYIQIQSHQRQPPKIPKTAIVDDNIALQTRDKTQHQLTQDSTHKKDSAENVQPQNIREPRRVPMNRLRIAVAKRMVQAQQNAAILTTFNEVDLSAVKELRAQYGEAFVKKNGVKLGFMSFFVKAVTYALKAFPIINASTEGSDILYHDYYDIAIAVASKRGLVVPVLRDTNSMSFAEIESTIKGFAVKANEGSLAMEEMTGGCFTITNGGTFGSLLSTPILNPPQSAILGMHKIMQRPIAIDDKVVIRPMMNLALSYDHRIIDGSDAVQFLVSVKDKLENPASILLEI